MPDGRLDHSGFAARRVITAGHDDDPSPPITRVFVHDKLCASNQRRNKWLTLRS